MNNKQTTATRCLGVCSAQQTTSNRYVYTHYGCIYPFNCVLFAPIREKKRPSTRRIYTQRRMKQIKQSHKQYVYLPLCRRRLFLCAKPQRNTRWWHFNYKSKISIHTSLTRPNGDSADRANRKTHQSIDLINVWMGIWLAMPTTLLIRIQCSAGFFFRHLTTSVAFHCKKYLGLEHFFNHSLTLFLKIAAQITT